MAALLTGIPAGILSALVAWSLGVAWFWVLVAYGLGGAIGCLGIAAARWFLHSGRLTRQHPTVARGGPRLARASVASRKQFREP